MNHNPPPHHAPVLARVCDGETVPALDFVGATVACGDPLDVRVAALDFDCAAVPVDVGVTGTHAPHVSPGNPGAPGVDDTAVYPAAQVPAHATPHVVYPTGQGVQVVALVAYCPGGQAGVEEGDTARLREPAGVRVTEPARVCVGVLVAPASSRCATRWEGVFDGDSVGLADRVGDRVAAPDRVGVRVLAGDLGGEREPEADLDEVPVALGDAVGDTTMQEPQVDGVNPTAQAPENTALQVAYPIGQAMGAGVADIGGTVGRGGVVGGHKGCALSHCRAPGESQEEATGGAAIHSTPLA